MGPGRRRGGAAGVGKVLDEALRAGVVVVLDYVAADGQRTTKRPVEPMAYAQNHGQWYLLAWCRRRRDGRWFRLDRIAAAWPTTQPFAARDVMALFGQPPDDAAPVAPGLASALSARRLRQASEKARCMS